MYYLALRVSQKHGLHVMYNQGDSIGTICFRMKMKGKRNESSKTHTVQLRKLTKLSSQL